MNRKTILILCGALGAVMAGPARANLVTNGGFETNDLTNFTGWNISGNGIAVDTAFPASGTFDASFGATSGDPSPGILAQPLATSAGTPYVLTFSLLDESGFPLNSFTVTFGGFSMTLTGDSVASYTTESFLVPGTDITGASTTLSFQGTNDILAWALDDVSVVSAIPEPSAGLLLAASVLAFPLLLGGRFGGWLKASTTVRG